jgi:hypothetical protein
MASAIGREVAASMTTPEMEEVAWGGAARVVPKQVTAATVTIARSTALHFIPIK